MIYSDKLKDLKKRIKEKFGTVSFFCECSEYPYSEIVKIFSMKMNKLRIDDEIKQVEVLLASTPVLANPDHIPDPEREMLRATIMSNYRSINSFLVDHPEFTKSFMSNIINGKRVKNDDRYRKLKGIVGTMKYKPQPVGT
jgi:hypothetical protein